METGALISFGELLKTYRRQMGLTQQQLARKLDIHQNTIGAWERGDYLPATRGMILELARGLRLSESETHHLLEASLLAVTFYWSLLSRRNPFFTGRQAVLQQLHTFLFEEQDTTSLRSCALSGLGGIGKTQTATEYAYRYASDYAAVFWVDAGTEASLLESFMTIARILKLQEHYHCTQKQEDVVAPVLNWLTLHRGWLLIFDNVEESAPIQRFVPVSRHGSLLLTTRLPTLGPLAPCLELQPLSVEESTQLLLSRARTRTLYQSSAPIDTDETMAVQTIVAIISGLPLALDLTAAYIEESQCRFAESLALFQRDELQVLRVHPSSAIYPHSVERTFTLAFEQLQRQNPVAADLLKVCCFLAPNEIPEPFLITCASHLNGDLRIALSEPSRLHMIFKDLLTYALLRRDAQYKTLSIHCLVQTVLRSLIPEATQKVWIERLVYLLDRLFPIERSWRDTKHWEWYEQVLPHIQHVLQFAEYWQLVSSDLGSLLCKVAIYLFHRARYEQAESLYLHAISVQEQALGMDHPDTAFSLNGLAFLYCDLGRYKEAETLALRALSIYEQKVEPGHSALASPLENLARLFYQQKRYEEAEALVTRARAQRERNAQSDHAELGLSFHLEANIHRAQGRYEQAESLYQHALHLYQEDLGPKYINVAFLIEDFAILSLYQGRLEEAEYRYQEALRAWERYQELDHPAHARCLKHYAELLRQQQRAQEADSYLLRTQEIQHRRLAASQASRQAILASQEADSYLLRTQEIQHRRLAASQASRQAILASTDKEKKEGREVDLFETFLQECCVLCTQSSCRAADLWHAYQKWMQTQEGGIFLSRQAFAFRLKAKGCSPTRTNTSRIWQGIELKTERLAKLE